MKTIKYIGLLFMTLFISGCYTQLAIEERQQKNYDSNESSGDEYVTSDTVYYDEDSGSDEKVVNNYYVMPGYRRYLSHYYPSATVVVGDGFYFDWWMWDTWYPRWWYCDPWYPPVAYYPFWYYHPNYYHYGWYYDDYSAPSRYKYRDDNLARVRNNEGGRGSYTRRDAIKAYDRTRASTRERIGIRENETGARERSRIDGNETPRPGRITGTERGAANDRENRGTVRERTRETDPSVTPRSQPEPKARDKEVDRKPSGERKTIYLPRERKGETDSRRPDVNREPEKRKAPSNEGYSGRKSNPSPTYTPRSNNGGSRSTPPSSSGGGGRSRGSSDSPRRTR